jgi:hypothetical protein
MVQSKFLFLLAVTLTNVYYWRSRGLTQKLLEVNAARDAQMRIEADIEDEAETQDCEEQPDVVYIDSYEGSAGGHTTLPEIYGVDAVEFDQYRAKYLVLSDNNFPFVCFAALKLMIIYLHITKTFPSPLPPTTLRAFSDWETILVWS